MRPEEKSLGLLKITRSKAKMYEYGVPEQEHIALRLAPAELLTLTIGILGELSARTNTRELESSAIERLQESLRFAARYFDAYRQSRLSVHLDEYLLLLGAASYYLCNLPGSAEVLSAYLITEKIDLGARGLERLLLWLLKFDFSSALLEEGPPYGELIQALSDTVVAYYQNGSTENELLSSAHRLRRAAYDGGTPRELLLADAIAALVLRRYENSSRHCLPRYSGLPIADWEPVLRKPRFIREFWPAQRLLGERGVLEGASAVVQMPTSAGKSRAIELVIRSAFLAGRASLAVVVAPFRALCHEIRDNLSGAFQGENVTVDELSDVFQADFDVDHLLSLRGVLVVTPEKLVYVLRHTPELGARIQLLIYDEGHQFDTGARGVTYELLVTSLKTMVTAATQTILISAVLPNAEAIGTWLNGEMPNIVSGSGLIPTERTVAFASWQDRLGQLRFTEPENPDELQFFVPRVIEAFELRRRPKEKARSFPVRSDGGTIALYLGLRLAREGSVAIFCGRKDSVTTLCEALVEAYDRGLELEPPSKTSQIQEVLLLSALYEKNLGPSAAAAISARLGVFTHHGNTPHGLRLSVEHAMKTGLARFVICTSTLAQGVNLPIRYLIVASIYQGRNRIKVRDFHNLIGRAGRSGMHTEGSVLFADPDIYDKRNAWRERWRWLEIRKLLRPDESEPCDSALLSVFAPLESDDGRNKVPLEPMEIPRAYVATAENPNWVSEMAARFVRKGFTLSALQGQISQRVEYLEAIESFLMAHWEDVGAGDIEVNARELAEATLAYKLAEGEDDKERLVELFQLLLDHIRAKADDSARRRIYSRMLCGVDGALAVEAWVSVHLPQMVLAGTEEELMALMWPFLAERIKNRVFQKCRPASVLQQAASDWLAGWSFALVYDAMVRDGARIEAGKQSRKLKMDNVVEICENGLGYDGALTVGAVAEAVGFLSPEEQELTKRLQALQKRVKYGLPDSCSVCLYELGFSDRVIATELGQLMGGRSSRAEIVRELRREEQAVRAALAEFPSYFTQVLTHLLE